MEQNKDCVFTVFVLVLLCFLLCVAVFCYVFIVFCIVFKCVVPCFSMFYCVFNVFCCVWLRCLCFSMILFSSFEMIHLDILMSLM